uniref:Uncharacterized protein n=1 Tax=Rhizophora mucronata TaxID=61149 RepID=A0A2P2QFD0_RHIMU
MPGLTWKVTLTHLLRNKVSILTDKLQPQAEAWVPSLYLHNTPPVRKCWDLLERLL